MLDKDASFIAPDDRGEMVQVPKAKSRATVLDFWMTTCEPCADSVPALARVLPSLRDAGIDVVFVGVLDTSESIADARGVLARWGTNVPFLVDRDGGLQRQFNIVALPATLILDDAGMVRWVAPAGATADEIARAAESVR
jgi:cytochrome c biogenesis protein CcmG/thiol:disulfide interchange protein DsbE